MTKTGPKRAVDRDYGMARLRAARDFHAAARDAMTLAEPERNCSPIVSQIVLGAIAYTDAITAIRAGFVNRTDHGAAARLLREALGNALPDVQEKRLRRILGHKDEAQYGARRIGAEEARHLLAQLDDFAAWAEATF